MTNKEILKQILTNMDKHGCSVMFIFDNEQKHPNFAYSVGIHHCTGNPELIVTGLSDKLSHFIINTYNERVKDGEIFEVDKYYDDFIQGFKITFKEVEKKHHSDYFRACNAFYPDGNYKVLQVIYPSTSGIWHWEKEATEDFKWCIPILY